MLKRWLESDNDKAIREREAAESAKAAERKEQEERSARYRAEQEELEKAYPWPKDPRRWLGGHSDRVYDLAYQAAILDCLLEIRSALSGRGGDAT